LKKKKILWLASWYPNKIEPLSGDFIERHAKAASLQNDITVIHVMRDEINTSTQRTVVEKKQYEPYPALTAYMGYYSLGRSGSWSSFFSLLKYFRLQKQLIEKYISENGQPDLIHVHISFKAGLAALYCRWRYGIPYIISEQWTIFCPEAKPSLNDQPYIVRWFIRQIYKNASGSTAVSGYLADSLSKTFSISGPVKIANVVDANLFFPSKQKHDIFSFIHISVLNYQKSPEDIITAIELLRQKSQRSFQLIIYGPKLKSIADAITSRGLVQYIQYRGEVMQDELSAEVRKCHALLLYSKFETFGCVVIEAFASGLPVLVSDIPVMRELVHENVNGIFAPPGDPDMLAERMLWMMNNYQTFDAAEIAHAAANKYAFEKIGEEFNEVYEKVLKRSSSPTPVRSHQE
jgi:glycosyltransferase involved in cell wall biosynthesis